jgi:hypothetical protein
VTQPTEQIADRSQDHRPPARMTGRGAVLAMFALFFTGAAIADLLHLGVLAGLSFLAGCVLAVRFARRSALLIVVVSPPLIFLIAVACAESISSSPTGHSRVLSAAEGTILTLAAAAPWLFGGEALGLVLALFRGLPQCVRDLRAGLRGPVSPGPGGAPWADTQY